MKIVPGSFTFVPSISRLALERLEPSLLARYTKNLGVDPK
jgi:hypothetical protein